MLKNISTSKCTYLVLCVSFGMSFNVEAASDINKRLFNQVAASDVNKHPSDDDYQTEGMRQTLNLNFSPENREKLRKALRDYSRAVDPAHNQIEERRRAMQASIEARFLEADNDGDGTIDRQEATEKLPQIARRFNQVDTNQDNLISLEELQAELARILERRKIVEISLEAQNAQETEVLSTSKRNNKQVVNATNKSSN